MNICIAGLNRQAGYATDCLKIDGIPGYSDARIFGVSYSEVFSLEYYQ